MARAQNSWKVIVNPVINALRHLRFKHEYLEGLAFVAGIRDQRLTASKMF